MILKLGVLILCIFYVVCGDHVLPRPCTYFDSKHGRDALVQTYSSNVTVEVSDCKSTDEFCALIPGTTYTVIITFKPIEDFVERTDFRVEMVFTPTTVPYGQRANACDAAVTSDDGTSCTHLGGFLASREYKHTSILGVSNRLPPTKLRIRYIIRGRQTKKKMVCIEVPVEIMDLRTLENED